jgi:hypothetical protein
MTPWQVITGFWLDDWIYWHLLVQSIIINPQPNSSTLTAEDSLHSRSPSTTDVVRFCTTYKVSRRTHRKHICFPGNVTHIKNISSAIVIFTMRCITTEVIRSLRREYVHQVVAQQRVCMSQCKLSFGVRGSVVGWGNILQVGRSWLRLQRRSLDFSVDLIFPAKLWPRVWLSL